MSNIPEDAAILGFYISFEPRRMHVEFRTETQAVEYLKKIQQRLVYTSNSLQGEQNGKVCSLRLPSRIVSANVWGSEIYLTFNDKEFADDWVNGLLIWGFRKNQDGTESPTDVCLYRAATNKQLNRALGISEHEGAKGSGVSHRPSNTVRPKLPRAATTSATSKIKERGR
ncbi:hypothetical protein F5144DRAFT_244258 [Chaetomium tenue]|uniref:Uncharacterized protein n=1 Tax=Chaetomium tenue TaxID=1854479 RepID=A0ACB7P7E5_9PEZI|nr:hypothetical protein F5144DRAFT_244258 [Chaetomium globosum]